MMAVLGALKRVGWLFSKGAKITNAVNQVKDVFEKGDVIRKKYQDLPRDVQDWFREVDEARKAIAEVF